MVEVYTQTQKKNISEILQNLDFNRERVQLRLFWNAHVKTPITPNLTLDFKKSRFDGQRQILTLQYSMLQMCHKSILFSLGFYGSKRKHAVKRDF